MPTCGCQRREVYAFINNNAVIVRHDRIDRHYPEETLRLLNGYYPTGDPKPGEWIKIVE